METSHLCVRGWKLLPKLRSSRKIGKPTHSVLICIWEEGICLQSTTSKAQQDSPKDHIYQRHVHEAFPNASKAIEALYDTVDEMEKRARPTILTNFGAGYLVVRLSTVTWNFMQHCHDAKLPLIGLQGTCSRNTLTSGPSGGLFPSVKLHSATSILKVLVLVGILLAWQIQRDSIISVGIKWASEQIFGFLCFLSILGCFLACCLVLSSPWRMWPTPPDPINRPRWENTKNIEVSYQIFIQFYTC